MWIRYEKRDVLFGLVVYAAGDTVATLILGTYDPVRMLGMMLVGATIYAFEIPNYCERIEICSNQVCGPVRGALAKTGLALLYFNPLWIARHLLFIAIFSGNWSDVGLPILMTALISWVVNIPISITGNAVIQLAIPLRWRFLGSAVFSALLAVYYALSGVWFAQ
ncbi:MAG: hypothetical protein GF405_05345 [Candidatus Eisenbacteria bacterium]|nr:hypothetical protein [Candidatus Eisenbacteria bacterium]